ncbi:unnamed protein product [Closterium sp. NIES-54]
MTSGLASAAAFRAGCMAAAKRRGPSGSPWRTPVSVRFWLGPRCVRVPGAWVLGAWGFQNFWGRPADWSGFECHDSPPQTATSRKTLCPGDNSQVVSPSRCHLERVFWTTLTRTPPMPSTSSTATARTRTGCSQPWTPSTNSSYSANAPPPPPVGVVAVVAAPLAPPAPPAAAAPSSVPVPLSSAPQPNLPHTLPASGAPVLVAQPPPVAPSPIHAVAGGPAPGTAVGAGPDSAHLVAPAAAPARPVVQRLAESHIRGAAGGNAAAYRGRGSPRRRPS